MRLSIITQSTTTTHTRIQHTCNGDAYECHRRRDRATAPARRVHHHSGGHDDYTRENIVPR